MRPEEWGIAKHPVRPVCRSAAGNQRSRAVLGVLERAGRRSCVTTSTVRTLLGQARPILDTLEATSVDRLN